MTLAFETALIALGGNLGDVPATMAAAIESLDHDPACTVTGVSRLYRTEPVGGPEQPAFFNAAIALSTAWDAHRLLDRLLAVEAAHGRERQVHWGPRTLDLDLIYFGDQVIDDPPRLRVPHPRVRERRFVLAPLCDIAADFRDPETGQALSVLLTALPAVPGDVEPVAETWIKPPLQEAL